MMKSSEIGSEKENVLIHKGNCSLAILPRLGGKIASLRVQGHELLQAPLAPLLPRSRTGAFDESDAGGWDECLPSVAACTVETAGGAVSIPDHGDLWRVEWAERREQGTGNREQSPHGSDGVSLRADCFSLPLTLEREVELIETAAGWQVRLDYKLTNTGSFPAPWSWAAHPLFAVEAGDRIVLPGSIGELRVECSSGARLGKPGGRVAWPVAKLADGSLADLSADLSLVQPPESEIGDKLFAGRLAAAENWCALERPQAGVRITVRFDPAATPYLGLWICYGGWPARNGPKQMCVALEPATAPTDSLARTGAWSRTLRPGECFTWTMRIDLEIM